MNRKKEPGKILEKIFERDGNIEVVCSLHERELTLSEISGITSLPPENLKLFLDELLEYNIVRKRVVDGEEHFTITDTKICDSVFMLKDTIYKLSRDRNRH